MCLSEECELLLCDLWMSAVVSGWRRTSQREHSLPPVYRVRRGSGRGRRGIVQCRETICPAATKCICFHLHFPYAQCQIRTRTAQQTSSSQSESQTSRLPVRTCACRDKRRPLNTSFPAPPPIHSPSPAPSDSDEDPESSGRKKKKRLNSRKPQSKLPEWARQTSEQKKERKRSSVARASTETRDREGSNSSQVYRILNAGFCQSSELTRNRFTTGAAEDGAGKKKERRRVELTPPPVISEKKNQELRELVQQVFTTLTAVGTVLTYLQADVRRRVCFGLVR